MSADKRKSQMNNGLMRRYTDDSYLEFKLEHERHSVPSRECEVQILAILCQQTSVSLAQICRLTKFSRETIEQAIGNLVCKGECSLAGSVFLRAAV
jgi:hypothetical protein